MFLRFVMFTFWNYYVLKLLRLETMTFSDARYVKWHKHCVMLRFVTVPYTDYRTDVSAHVPYHETKSLHLTILSLHYFCKKSIKEVSVEEWNYVNSSEYMDCKSTTTQDRLTNITA